MESRPEYIIDLAKYGQNGTIVMGPLTFRRKNELRNVLGKCVRCVGGDGAIGVKEQDLGDMALYSAMAFVYEAPFKHMDMESFLEFMDRVDAYRLGAAQELYDEIRAGVEKIKGGELSPFAKSDVSQIPNSESN